MAVGGGLVGILDVLEEALGLLSQVVARVRVVDELESLVDLGQHRHVAVAIGTLAAHSHSSLGGGEEQSYSTRRDEGGWAGQLEGRGLGRWSWRGLVVHWALNQEVRVSQGGVSVHQVREARLASFLLCSSGTGGRNDQPPYEVLAGTAKVHLPLASTMDRRTACKTRRGNRFTGAIASSVLPGPCRGGSRAESTGCRVPKPSR